MAEYIERDAAISSINDEIYFTESTKAAFRNIIVKVPVDDVAPVVHGRWIPVGKLSIGGLNGYTQFYKCSNCEYLDFIESRYRSGCGAKMDLEG